MYGSKADAALVVMFVPPAPVFTLLLAACFAELDVVFVMIVPIRFVVARLVVVPVVIVLVIAVVKTNDDLRCCADFRCQWSDERCR